jgi:hypothetical protein
VFSCNKESNDNATVASSFFCIEEGDTSNVAFLFFFFFVGVEKPMAPKLGWKKKKKKTESDSSFYFLFFVFLF